MGHAVSVLLGLAESEKLKELRVKAMMGLQCLAQCAGELDQGRGSAEPVLTSS